MGRAIVYCGDCGRSLREDDFERGRAQTLDGQPYCSTCRAPVPEAVPAKDGSSRARPRDASSGSTRRIVVVPPGPLRRPAGLWVGVGVSALVGAVLMGLLWSGGGRRPPPPPNPIKDPVVLHRPAPA